MPKSRILFLNHIGHVSGAEIVLMRVIERLDPKRYERIGMCPFDGKLRERFDELMHVVEPLPMKSTTGGFLSKLMEYFHSMRAAYRAIGKHRIDLIHANGFRAALIAGPVGRLRNVPVIWHMHDILRPKLKNQVVVWLYSRLVQAIVAVSNATRVALLNEGAQRKKVHRIYNGLNLATIEKKANSDQELLVNPDGPKVLMIGQITSWKGQDVLLNAIPEICNKNNNTLFFIVGESHLPADKLYQAQLVKQAAAFGLDKKIFWLGFRRDVPALIKQADVVVHCSVYPDPLPTVILEGMALKRVVVASDIGGVSEMVIDGVTGHLYPPGNSAALAKKIQRVFDDPQLAEQMGQRAGERIAEIFSMKINQETIERLYRQLLPHHAPQNLTAPQQEGNGGMA